MMITNIIITGQNGDFDYEAEGFEPEIVEVLEDGITYVNPMTEEFETHDCYFKENTAVIQFD